MDSITHGLAGAVIAYCGFQQRQGRAALCAGILAAEFPDLDVVLAFASSETYLRWHRTVTHSALLLPFWAIMAAGIVWAFTSRSRFSWLWLTAVAALASHLALDWITNYGTQLLWPVSGTRFALSWVFIVDIYIWVVLLTTLVAAIITQRERVAMAGLLVASGFVLCCGGLHWRAWRAARAAGIGRVEVFAQPLNPLRWTVVREEGNQLHWINGGQNKTFMQSGDPRLLAKAESTGTVKLFRWFAGFPLVEQLKMDGNTVLRYRDLRFRTPMPWGEVSEGMFLTATIVFDQRGNLLSAGLGHADDRSALFKVEPSSTRTTR